MSFQIVVAALFLAFSTVKSELCREILKDYKNEESAWKIDPQKDINGERKVGNVNSIVQTAEKTLEEYINIQINVELCASYTYTSMTAHFDRDDIHLPGFAKFFKEAAEEDYKQAMKLMEYNNKRGGRVKLHKIKKPSKDQWGNGLMAMNESLNLEKIVYDGLLLLHEKAENASNPQMMDFIEGNFLHEQIDSIKMLGNYVNTLKRFGDNYDLGEYQFDMMTLGGGKRSD